MYDASLEFAHDPIDPQKRSVMTRASRALLAAVTRLLCVADMADVQRMLKKIDDVSDDLKDLVNAISDPDDLIDAFKDYGDDVADLLNACAGRQGDLKSQRHKDMLAQARNEIQNSSKLLYTSSKALATHPGDKEAHKNREFAMNEIKDALQTIADVLQATGNGGEHPFERTGSLSNLFEELLENLDNDPESFYQRSLQKDVSLLCDEVIDGSQDIANTVATTPDIKKLISESCLGLEDAQSALLSACAHRKQGNIEKIAAARGDLEDKTNELKKHVKGCVTGSVADSFLSTTQPLEALVEAAESGDRDLTAVRTVAFLDHSDGLADVAEAATRMSENAEGNKMVRIAAKHLKELGKEVARAAETTAKYPASKAAVNNLHAFRDEWLKQVALLTAAVDDITNIDDYLAICQQRVQEDTDRAVEALQEKDIPEVEKAAEKVTKRLDRVQELVIAELENHEPSDYTRKVEKRLDDMKSHDLSFFLDHIDRVVQSADGSDIDEQSFVESAQRVNSSFKQLRKAVARQNSDETDIEEEVVDLAVHEEEVFVPASGKKTPDYFLDSAKAASTLMRALTKDQKLKINLLANDFDTDKDRLLSEVSKWEEQGNEIIVIAKKMCMIMMDLSDFTRGKGVLKNSIDVIKASETIAKHGVKLTKLVQQVCQDCSHSLTKSDLVAYIQRIALYSHQLNMTARVKADVHMIRGEAIMGIENVKSLIETGRNLMNSVMLTVRSSYIASTKHRSENMTSSVSWRMRPAEMKPLIEFNNMDVSTATKIDTFGMNF